MLDWIVCLGAERAVADGRVVCPTSPIVDGHQIVPLADCLTCRHLVAACVDREAAAMCSAEPLV